MDPIYTLGQIAVIGIAAFLAALIFAGVLIVSALRGRTVWPRATMALTQFFESPIKTIANLIGLNTEIIDRLRVDLANSIWRGEFRAVPYAERALFLPQCLRSVRCPARLGPEGIECRECGRCVIAQLKKRAEQLGYRVFVVPGSSFIKRMIVKYKPKAILGVGCLIEVKDGIELCTRYNLPSQGVVLKKSGCVGTIVDVDEVLERMEMAV